ncbi:MAG: D-glycero-beta-D-manno-heptose 1-phosphate adenylyltransferase [Bdellovibrionia bacterium]
MRPLYSKIQAAHDLRPLLEAKKSTGAQVVFTNGCFDLIHKGHVTYLEQARGCGDLLVVALNSDESVRSLKGPTRPISPLADRLEVIAALESVDFVTWFESSTPLELIEWLQPQVLVKGGDWSVDQIVGSKQVLAQGGRVHSLPFVPGRSTTELIQRARRF